jgi:acetoin utilization protein AcuB
MAAFAPWHRRCSSSQLLKSDQANHGTAARQSSNEEAVMEEPVTAGDLMTPDPITVTPEASVAEVWDIMREREIRHMPVVQGGTLVGMLSDRDLARLDIVRVLTAQGADALRHELAMPIVKVMSSDVIVVEPETELGDVVELLLEHKVGALPVVEPDTREVVGIVSYIDVLRELYERLGEEEE